MDLLAVILAVSVQLAVPVSPVSPVSPPAAASPGPLIAVSPVVETAGWQPGERLSLAQGAIAGRVQVLNTKHFRLYLPDSPAPEVQETLDSLDAAWSFYAATLGSLLPLPPDHTEVTVFVVDRATALDALEAGLSFTPDGRRAGVLWHSSPPLIAFDHSTVLGPSDLGVLMGVMVRVAHDVLLYEPEVAGSWWVREGFAVYITQTRRDGEGEFVAGKVRTSEGYIEDITPRGRMADGLEFVEEPLKSLKTARKAYRRGGHLPLRELLDISGRGLWTAESTRESASVESWVLVHFLLHGQEGELRPRPSSFLARERRGEGGAETFRKTVSRDIERFETFLYAHTKKMK